MTKKEKDPLHEQIIWTCARGTFAEARNDLLQENIDIHYGGNKFFRVAVTNEHMELIEFLMCSKELKQKNALCSLNDPEDSSFVSCIMSARLESLKKLHEIHGDFLPGTNAYKQYCTVMSFHEMFGVANLNRDNDLSKKNKDILYYLIFEIDVQVTPELQAIINESSVLEKLFLKNTLNKMPTKKTKLRVKI